ncbi:tetraspanin-2 [Quercus suber]|uniref:Tetraspanin-2 n=1 Tax=Quercus suber TaxID=58331 RepID=A0AAW0KKS1_QUESU
MGVSNNITATLNFIAFLASIPIIASGIWLASKPDNECTHYFRWPVVILGFLILLVSLAGFVGAYRNKQGLLAFYLICMAILIALLLILLVFAFTVTRPDGSYSVPGRGYKEYRIDGFSQWLRDHVTNSDNWVSQHHPPPLHRVALRKGRRFARRQFYMLGLIRLGWHLLMIMTMTVGLRNN